METCRPGLGPGRAKPIAAAGAPVSGMAHCAAAGTPCAACLSVMADSAIAIARAAGSVSIGDCATAASTGATGTVIGAAIGAATGSAATQRIAAWISFWRETATAGSGFATEGAGRAVACIAVGAGSAMRGLRSGA